MWTLKHKKTFLTQLVFVLNTLLQFLLNFSYKMYMYYCEYVMLQCKNYCTENAHTKEIVITIFIIFQYILNNIHSILFVTHCVFKSEVYLK